MTSQKVTKRGATSRKVEIRETCVLYYELDAIVDTSALRRDRRREEEEEGGGCVET